MHSHIRPLGVVGALCAALVSPGLTQEPEVTPRPNGSPHVFLDCHTRSCDFDHFRREITFVSWVRDRADADVHILITSQRTGSGGEELTLGFIGLRSFAGQDASFRYVSRADDVWEERRDGLTRTLQLGLVGYAAATTAADRLSVVYREAPLTSADAVDDFESDPWDYWVFRLNLRGSINGETSERFWSGNTGISASRVTEGHKLVLSARANGDRSEFDVADEAEGLDTTYVSTRTSYGANAYSVWSLNPHWSTGVVAEVNRASTVNLALGVQGGPAIEYSVFPYAESTRRQLTILYTVGVVANRYVEETVYDKTSEVLPAHVLEIDLDVQQPWGSVHGSIDASQYLHDLAKHSLRLEGRLSLRVFRGLDFNIGADVARIKDQLYLPKEDLTAEEILLRVRARETNFRYGLNVGLSFRFGSKFNNVVNPRMW